MDPATLAVEAVRLDGERSCGRRPDATPAAARPMFAKGGEGNGRTGLANKQFARRLRRGQDGDPPKIGTQPRLVSARGPQPSKASAPMLREGVAVPEGLVADAGDAFGQACQREGGAALEGAVADAGEAVRKAGQREGGAAQEGLVADTGEAVGQAGQREGGAFAGQREGGAAVEGAVADAGEAVRQAGQR
eukprot:scaffold72512_cov51-Phaeocystis_antarctica.AAC.2